MICQQKPEILRHVFILYVSNDRTVYTKSPKTLANHYYQKKERHCYVERYSDTGYYKTTRIFPHNNHNIHIFLIKNKLCP